MIMTVIYYIYSFIYLTSQINILNCFTLYTGQIMCSSEDEIQLNAAGLFSPGAGCVEICQCSSSSGDSSCFWATINTGSTQPLGWKNAIVVCRDLGYDDVMSPIFQNTYVQKYSDV